MPIIPTKIYNKNLYHDVFNSYVIRTKKQFSLFKFLRKKGIEVLINWPKPLYRHKGLKLKNYNLKNNEKICKEIISLPIYPEMLKSEFNYIVKTINSFFKR